jgi:hypothetical protein
LNIVRSTISGSTDLEGGGAEEPMIAVEDLGIDDSVETMSNKLLNFSLFFQGVKLEASASNNFWETMITS